MTASLLTFERRARARFQTLAWHALRHARSDEEAALIETLCAAVRAGHVRDTDAHASLAALRRQQQAA